MDVIKAKTVLLSDLKLKAVIKELLQSVLKNKTFAFYCKDKLVIKKLLEYEVIAKSDDGDFIFNTNSDLANFILLEIIMEDMETPMPTDLVSLFNFIDQFAEKINLTDDNGYWTGLEILIKNIEKYSILYLNKILDISAIELFESVEMAAEEDDHEIRRITECYFEVLYFMTNQESDLLLIVKKNHGIKNNRYIGLTFFKKLSNYDTPLAQRVYECALSNDGLNFRFICAVLVIGLYDNNASNSINKITALFDLSTIEGLQVLIEINYKNAKDIKGTFPLIKSGDPDYNIQLSKYYAKLINIEFCPPEIIKECFKEIESLYSIDSIDLKRSILLNCRLIDGFEEHKYLLLEAFIKIGIEYNEIPHYFLKFNNPVYFFNTYLQFYAEKGFGLDFYIFRNVINNFWRKNRNDTEKYILEILGLENLYMRLSAVKLLKLAHHGRFDIDLNKLDHEILQKRAIDALVMYPNAIEAVIPLVLQLKKSKYKKVINYLQGILACKTQ